MANRMIMPILTNTVLLLASVAHGIASNTAFRRSLSGSPHGLLRTRARNLAPIVCFVPSISLYRDETGSTRLYGSGSSQYSSNPMVNTKKKTTSAKKKKKLHLKNQFKRQQTKTQQRQRTKQPTVATVARTLQNDDDDGGIPYMAQTYPDQYDTLLTTKVNDLHQMLTDAVIEQGHSIMASPSTIQTEVDNLPTPHVFASPTEGFRMRANFHIWRTSSDSDETKIDYVMFEPGTQNPYRVTRYPMGSNRLQDCMSVLRAALNGEHTLLAQKLKEVTFHTTLNNDSDNAVIVLNYYDTSFVSEEWKDAAQTLSTMGNNVTVVGASRKLAESIIIGGTATLTERLTVSMEGENKTSKSFEYYQTEGTFSQPNAQVCEKMLEWAYNATLSTNNADVAAPQHDLCELYCGNGCFTVVLASNFQHVIATEVSSALVRLAQQNLVLNGVENVRVVPMTSEEFVTVYQQPSKDQDTKTLTARRKLQNAGVELVNPGSAPQTDLSPRESESITMTNLRTLFMDPPRAGLTPAVREMASQQFDRIMYMSCNPQTLQRDLVDGLLLTHKIVNVASFDQFPYTPHLEVGVVLERR